MREFDSEFSERHENLVKDLEYIDLKINSINRNIVYLQSTIDRIGLVIDDPETENVFQYYEIQNESLKTLSMYDSNMQSLLDLKYKYRKEQDDLTVKSQRFLHIELEKVKSDIAKTSSSHIEVIEALTKMLSGKHKAEEPKQQDNDEKQGMVPIFEFNAEEQI